MKKRNTSYIDNSNKYILFICFTYGFTGMNFIICSIAERLQGEFLVFAIILGVLMLCMVPISLLDERKEMRGKLNAVTGGIMHFLISMGISYVFSSKLFIAIYVVELIASLIITRIITKKNLLN